MTLWVIRTTNFLKKKFKNKGRLPEIKTEISQTTNKIFSILTSRELDNNWIEFNRRFSMEVKTCYPVINNLLSKVESDQKKCGYKHFRFDCSKNLLLRKTKSNRN
ncbi:conserved hypothetical protein [Klebsiella variicola]|jgi:hypothetical protein|uniref:Uncharacterized protein n=1 Tax=Klebsiella variicola (strain 342) TaxID=507522 RepID=B5XR32_KLEV3|nr:conserved hypothetical protein [Klebsiella variicola]